MRINILLTHILIILLFQNVSAQWHSGKSIATVTPWEIGLSGGVSTFMTSVNPASGAPNKQINYWNRDVNPGVGLSVVRNLSPAIGIELNWLNTRLTGKWKNSYPLPPISEGHEIPLTFNSQINQIDLMGAFNVNQLILPGDEEDIWHIFVKTGIGITNVKDSKKFYPGVTSTQLSIIFDAGLSFSISEKIKLMAGSTFRFVNTDNLDGVHVTSTDISGETVNWMQVYEIYNYSYLKVSYCLDNFGSKKTRSTFKNRKGKFGVYRRR